MATRLSRAFDDWIRKDFKAINSELESLYFAQQARENVSDIGENLKQDLVIQGNHFVSRLLKEGNTDEGFDSGFDLLGNVGFFLAACRRHEVPGAMDRSDHSLKEASALAMHLGASLGVVPRFASAHLETHNRAINGEYKTFTSLEDEKIFLDYNVKGVFAYIRASEALLHCLPLGISHPVTKDLLEVATVALNDVYVNNETLFAILDVDHFFFNVRPYYKTHRVGRHEYRGANAGDFAGINVIDLLLGLCRGDDPYYSQLLVDKFLFMRPQDQLILRDCMRRKSLMDEFIQVSEQDRQSRWYQDNLRAFLAVCAAHGKTAIQHHQALVSKFIVKPANDNVLTQKQDMTASGPPLDALITALKKLHDLRTAANRNDIPTRYQDVEFLRTTLTTEQTQ
ncbi:PrnB family protein [Candidatus Sororendozoicomonas aggregata]|uniref:PrnB family protein n=1 Tax=Candidatus Sororendozoicomonas aggregata TaxID=3073239 RepID=UPI002ED335D4